MKIVIPLLILTPLFSFGTAQTESRINGILNRATADGIDLSVLKFLDAALAEISAVYKIGESNMKRNTTQQKIMRRQTPTLNDIIDVHGHVIPSWYKDIVPITGGNPTPSWDLASHLSFMGQEGISRAVISISTPGANVFQGDKIRTIALARLLNENLAAYCRIHPAQFNFFAVVPLPYTQAAIKEANYALNHLGAVGIALLSNFEGSYLGATSLRPFFEAINQSKTRSRPIIFVHPSTPCIKVGNLFVEANPTIYPTGNVEFYYETARTFMDLTLTQTIHNFTNIHFIVPHAGGAFPAIIDRFLKSAPTIYNSSFNIYSTRFWWDSAGPTYFHQIADLLGINIPKTQFLFGTDFPYAPSFTQEGSLDAIKNSPFFTTEEKSAIFRSNAANLLAPGMWGSGESIRATFQNGAATSFGCKAPVYSLCFKMRVSCMDSWERECYEL